MLNPAVFDENSVREIPWLSYRRCRKAPISKNFPFTLERKPAVFKFLRFEERFRKVPLTVFTAWRISVDGRPNRRNKAASSNYSGVVWTWKLLKGLTWEVFLQLRAKDILFNEKLRLLPVRFAQCVTDNLLKTVTVTLPLSSFVIHFNLGQSFNSSHLLLFNLSPWVRFLPRRIS